MLQICFPICKGSVVKKHFPLAAWYLFLVLNSCFISFYASRRARGDGRTRGWALWGAMCFPPPFISPKQVLQTCPDVTGMSCMCPPAFPMGNAFAGRLTGPVVYRGIIKDQRGCLLSLCVPAWYSPQHCCQGASPGQVGAIPSFEPVDPLARGGTVTVLVGQAVPVALLVGQAVPVAVLVGRGSSRAGCSTLNVPGCSHTVGRVAPNPCAVQAAQQHLGL